MVRRHTLVNGLSEAGAGARTGWRTNNLWSGYGPHLIHRPPVVRTYKALQLKRLNFGVFFGVPSAPLSLVVRCNIRNAIIHDHKKKRSNLHLAQRYRDW